MPLVLPDSLGQPALVNDTANVSTEALRGLSADTIVHEIKRLQNSVDRLRSSNAQIQQFVNDDPDAKDLEEHDRAELNNACNDNLVTISKQQGLIDRLADVLAEKVGGAREAAHYAGLSDASAQQVTHDGQPQSQHQQQQREQDQDAPGVFL